ncbi:MAG: hypothetical protein ACI3XP_01095 [Eubacteriales bacterium]
MNRQERYRHYLELCANLPEGQENICYEFAKVTCGKQTDEEAILRILLHMKMRLDCGDFRLNIILRMLHLYPDTPLLGDDAKAEIKALLLDFDYWYGENVKYPGKQIIWTENHVMLFMVAEYLAAKLYPEEQFRFRGKKGAEIVEDVRAGLIEWMDLKLRVGFSEWDSNCYTNENVLSLLNVYDFTDDAELKRKAKALLDVITFSMAVNSYKGNYCCTHGRTYLNQIVRMNSASTTMLESLMWGVPEVDQLGGRLDFGSMALTTSSYEPQPIIDKIALDDTLVFEDYEQESFDVEDAHLFGKGYDKYDDMPLFWQNMAYSHVKIVDTMCEMCEKYGIMVNPGVYPDRLYVQRCRKQGIEPEPCRVGTYMPRVNKVTYKTPDYLLSCAQDFRKGQRGFQQHIWQATMGDDAVVFTTHPGTLETGDYRPNFWSGNWFHPKAVQYRDTVICIYNIEQNCRLPYSHAYFPKNKFDEAYEVGNWVFGRKADGYVALYSQNGFEWSDQPKWKDQEMICRSRKNIWICQMGRKEEYGSFAQFISELLLCEVSCDGLSASFHSPKSGVICCGWDEPLTVDGKTIKIDGYRRFDNPFCQSEYLSGKYTITYQGESLTIEM